MSFLNIEYIILYVKSIVVATIVKYVKSLSNMFGFCLLFYVFV